MFWDYSEDNGIAVATFSNAPMDYLTSEGVEELRQIIDRCRSDSIRSLVLTGSRNGKFITHYSVEELYSLAQDKGLLDELGMTVNTGYYSLLESLRQLDKPVIAAINGDTMGGGLELCLACDIRICEHGDFKIGLPETKLGIIPGGSGTQTLSRLVGQAKAMDFILRGRVVDPVTALDIGIVHECVPDCLARSLDIAAELSAESSLAIGAAKRAIIDGFRRPFDEALLVEAKASQVVIRSDAARQKMKEYLDLPETDRRSWLEGP